MGRLGRTLATTCQRRFLANFRLLRAVLGWTETVRQGFRRTVDWAVHVGITTATFHILRPYPGTCSPRWPHATGSKRGSGTSTTRATLPIVLHACPRKN